MERYGWAWGKLRNVDKTKLADEYRKGASLGTLGKQYHTSANAIQYNLEKAGVPRRVWYNNLPSSVWSQIISEYQKGATTKQLAEKHHVATKTVIQHLKNANVEIRWHTPRTVSCGHLGKRHVSHGLCSSCYQKWRYRVNPRCRELAIKNAKHWGSANPEKVRRIWRNYAANNHEKVANMKLAYSKTQCGKEVARNTRLKATFGLSELDYQKMFVSQEGKCAICKKPSRKRLYIDHDHNTRQIRGLLCSPCNSHLAWFERFESKAKAYLTQPPAKMVLATTDMPLIRAIGKIAREEKMGVSQ